MILSQREIRSVVADGSVIFDPPLEEEQWGEASVDLRLGEQFTIFREDIDPGTISVSVAKGLKTIGQIGLWKSTILKSDTISGPERFRLESRKFVLAETLETITVPTNLIARVEGRSTYARMGLSMHQTAPWLQPGWSGKIILEIMNNGPLTIELTPRVDRPCQITFFQLTSPVSDDIAYGSKPSDTYQHQQHPLVHKN